MLTTLLESKAKPFGSSKGAVMSMVIHGLILTGIVIGTAKAVLPPREKFEEHPVLYVAAPPPPVHVAPDPLPVEKAAAPAPKRPEPPRPKLVQPKVAPKAAAVPAIAIAAPKIAVSLGDVDLKTAPVVEIAAAPAVTEPAPASSGTGTAKKSTDDDAANAGGLGSGSGKAYNENQVDKTVQISRNIAPRYPESLRSVGVQGVVVVRFIVSADGKVEPGSIEVLSAPHKLFGDAVRAALLNTRYRPAEAAGTKVRQLVEQNFSFKLNASDP